MASASSVDYLAKTHIRASIVSKGAALWPRLVRAAMMASIFLIVVCGLVLVATVLISASSSLLMSASGLPAWTIMTSRTL